MKYSGFLFSTTTEREGVSVDTPSLCLSKLHATYQNRKRSTSLKFANINKPKRIAIPTY